MLLIYRQTGRLFALLTLATVLLATAVVMAVAVTVVIVAVPIAAAVLLARAVLPRSWRRRTVPAATPWPHETIEATTVNPTASSEDHLLPVGDKG
jgi:hypothetical protein